MDVTTWDGRKVMLSILSWIFWVIWAIPINGEDVVIAGPGLARRWGMTLSWNWRMGLAMLVTSVIMTQRHSFLVVDTHGMNKGQIYIYAFTWTPRHLDPSHYSASFCPG